MTAKKNLAIENGSTGPGKIILFEDSDNGSNSVSIQAGSMSADVTYTLPTADGTANQVLATDGSGTLSWATANLDAVDIDGGAIDGTAIGANSASTGAFTTITAGSGVTANANLTVGNGATSAGSIIFNEDADAGSNTLTLKPAAMAANVTLTLPVDDGTSDQVLATDGNGALSWVTQSASSVPTGIGEKYIEITFDGVYGDGAVNFDLDDVLGSNNPWYVLEALTVTEWDGNTSYFNIQLNVSDEQENTGGLTIDYQSNRVRPRFYGSDNVIYIYSSNGQHSLTLNCQGRSSTIKVLFRVTSDWSS
jgi:hypothetical protein